MIHAVTAALVVRWQQMKELERDRGESPVTTALIIAGLVLLAVAVLGWAITRARAFMTAGTVDVPRP